MIDYKLALELKNTGFPQHEDGSGEYYGQEVHTELGKFYIPTLSELIEACGDKFQTLTRGHTGKFVCRSSNLNPLTAYSPDHVLDNYRGFGDTAEESVANLYLLLNKSNV